MGRFRSVDRVCDACRYRLVSPLPSASIVFALRALLCGTGAPLDEEVRDIVGTLGGWLAQVVLELAEYLPFQLTHVEAGGKLTDSASGELMLGRTRTLLASHRIFSVRRAADSEFGQAIACAAAASTPVIIPR